MWQIANLYHLTHTAALVGAPLTRRPHIVRLLFHFFLSLISISLNLSLLKICVILIVVWSASGCRHIAFFWRVSLKSLHSQLIVISTYF